MTFFYNFHVTCDKFNNCLVTYSVLLYLLKLKKCWFIKTVYVATYGNYYSKIVPRLKIIFSIKRYYGKYYF